jgi:uncharacterized protein YbcI
VRAILADAPATQAALAVTGAARSEILLPLSPRRLDREASMGYISARQGLRRLHDAPDQAEQQKRRTKWPRWPRRELNKMEAPQADRTRNLVGGHLLAAISTSIVGILRDHYGRGPMKAKTYALDDIIVVVMRGSGFTPLEQTIMDSGEPDRVIAMREDFQRVMAKRYKETIEELTGRKVLAFLSQAHVEPDITMEIFFVDRPLDGFGALEIVEPE